MPNFIRIEPKHLVPSNYGKTKTKKNAIILHHTAGSTVEGALATWKNDATRVATEFIIDRKGNIFQAFPTGYWAYALGLKNDFYKTRNEWETQAVQIELVAAGYLQQKGDNFFSPALQKNVNEVETLAQAWRGYKHFHTYTEYQIDALENLLNFIKERDEIPLKLDMDTLFNQKIDLLKAKKPLELKPTQTIFTHANFRKDKTDCYPSKLLTEMLQSIQHEAH